jgi:hypothetical protein
MSIAIRVGVDRGRRTVIERARRLGAPILISANTLWDAKRSRFRQSKDFDGLDVALDSGGFVAMKRYGGFRWSVAQYQELAARMQPSWYAQMDYCCEPEIAPDRGEIVRRIDKTVSTLEEGRAIARSMGMPEPMPVLQGWKAQDYTSGPIFGWRDRHWPALVGIGSVCRRHVHGEAGLLSIVRALDEKCPRHVQFHLFGVKSDALSILARELPERIASIDSMAWSVAAKWERVHAGMSRSGEHDAQVMESWYRAQAARVGEKETQLRLL